MIHKVKSILGDQGGWSEVSDHVPRAETEVDRGQIE